jgi:hypothetical protein
MYEVTRPTGNLMIDTCTPNVCEMELGLNGSLHLSKGVSLSKSMQ